MTRPFEALSAAVDRARYILFQPFDLTKYVTLAVCVFLYQLGSGVAWSGQRGGMPTGAGAPGDWRDGR